MADDRIILGDYTLTLVDPETISITMDDGEGGEFSTEDFIAAIEEFYRDNF